MGFARRILHYSPGPTDFVGAVAERAVSGAWFELHRQGGCGAGELRLKDEFPERDAVELGDWIAFEFEEGARWYLGRVEQRQAASPAGVTLRLEGMGVELGEVFPGGFGREVADGVPPHRYAATDLFPHDPDYFDETFDLVSEPSELVSLLLAQYVTPRTHIALVPGLVEAPIDAAAVTSLKFRGEESVRSVVKELALRARNASWGVDELGRFFFLRPKTEVLATWREGVDLIRLEESRDREFLFNRVLLTGDYVYGEPVNSDVPVGGHYRWRGNYIQPASRALYGERRIRMWVPWIRTASDSREFTREFFRVYAEPTSRYLVEVADRTVLPRPWLGRVRILDRHGAELINAAVETIRVQFDRVPRFRMELGPDDPRLHWPEPPHDERWEVANENQAGELITLPPTDTETIPPSDLSSDFSSGDFSSDFSSGGSSEGSSGGESTDPNGSSGESETSGLDSSGSDGLSGGESDPEASDSTTENPGTDSGTGGQSLSETEPVSESSDVGGTGTFSWDNSDSTL